MKERTFITHLADMMQGSSELLTKGIGDDCAVFGEEDGRKWVVTTDMLVENIHFVMRWHTPYQLGRKCIAVNLSDIAAMGANPLFALLSVSIPVSVDDEWCDRWLEGMRSMLQAYNCQLIGGDTTSGERLTINVTIIGIAKGENILYRSSARPGQDVYVTGFLGESSAGLQILQRGLNHSHEYERLLKAHLDPTPQVEAGQMLSNCRYVAAMQDISDGISTDIAHICKASGVSAIIERKSLPVSEEIQGFCDKNNIDVYDLILNGGEDYQLVFTAEPKAKKIIAETAHNLNTPITKIGVIEKGEGVFLIDGLGNRTDITFSGYEHSG